MVRLADSGPMLLSITQSLFGAVSSSFGALVIVDPGTGKEPPRLAAIATVFRIRKTLKEIL